MRALVCTALLAMVACTTVEQYVPVWESASLSVSAEGEHSIEVVGSVQGRPALLLVSWNVGQYVMLCLSLPSIPQACWVVPIVEEEGAQL